MGNFFTRYDAKVHSCTPNGPPAPYRSAPGPGFRFRYNVPRKELHCSSDDPSSQRKIPHQAPKSHAADPSKASFLDLPPELRNRIYAQLFILPDNYIRLTRENRTNVPSLTLLRTCKQIHDEAASVFYAGNSFYVAVERFLVLHSYRMDSQPEIDSQGGTDVHPKVEPDNPSQSDTAVWQYKWEYRKSPVFKEPLAKAQRCGLDSVNGGIQIANDFATRQLIEDLNVPALRYHRWLTRLTIDLMLCIQVKAPAVDEYTFVPAYLREYHPKRAEMDAIEDGLCAKEVDMQEQLSTLFCQMFENMRGEWTGKDTGWDGRTIIDADMIQGLHHAATNRAMRVMVSFAEREEQERMTKGYWKNFVAELG
ncbi:uncharacterized protein EI97DRAFT_467757 [Westerdykella ornata]|uniref:F-box domain-containing protein n=1 Tax=Westerdykella ornata TaxID=318751 RepID=A0A6A6JHA4_WESOR|nr:uncharacterized protein EI97DRAFT_467757 [Westerdykella ornata]KAF2275584.1 hypothetical protein EI97DRAFT_467757 [Westerdykella ornata]